MAGKDAEIIRCECGGKLFAFHKDPNSYDVWGVVCHECGSCIGEASNLKESGNGRLITD